MALVLILRIWVWFSAGVMIVYAIRHWVFSMNRLYARQRPYYQDLLDSEIPTVTVLIPMHNEEAVAEFVLESIIASDYPKDRLKVIAINDHSVDGTAEILARYTEKYPFIHALNRNEGARGKPAGLNDALQLTDTEVVLVFDADYQPSRGLVRELAMAFVDPEIGAVMGRVIPQNTSVGLITRLVDHERTGGYQVDQQARYNMDLIPQYGGTVGGFRRSVIEGLGGFDPLVLAEDTDLTYRLFCQGWRVVYANRAECYEETPETWDVRFRQVRRWARGHNQSMWRQLGPLIRSKYLNFGQKFDGLMLLGLYAVSPLLISAISANTLLLLMGEVQQLDLLLTGLVLVLGIAGNSAPFFEVTAGALLDGAKARTNLVPWVNFMFLFNTWASTLGFKDSILDLFGARAPEWAKTERFRKK